MTGDGATARPCFPADHPCESLRGSPVPDFDRIKRALVDRCTWLEHRIAMRVPLLLPVRRELAELAAIVALVEEAERWRDPPVVRVGELSAEQQAQLERARARVGRIHVQDVDDAAPAEPTEAP